MTQRNPLTNISNNRINDGVPSKNSANMKNCPSDKSIHNPLASHSSTAPPTSQFQVTFQPSFAHGNSGKICGFEYGSCPLQSTQALGASSIEYNTSQNQYFGAAQGYSFSSQPSYVGWNHYGYTTYPLGYYWPAAETYPPSQQKQKQKQNQKQPTIIPKRPSKPIQPRESSYRSFLVGLNEENVKSAFNECMAVCSKEKSIDAFEDLLTEGAKLNQGWLKKVFVQGDIPNNRMLKHYVWSILLTFDAQIKVAMRGKLVHAWGTNLDRLRSWRYRMKESTNFLQAIAKHQIDFRGHKTNPFLMYNGTLDIQKVQGMVAELETNANQLEDKMRMERALQLNKEKILVQERCIDALHRTERALEEENKKLSSSLKHWKNCYSKLNQENEDLKTLVNLPNKVEI